MRKRSGFFFSLFLLLALSLSVSFSLFSNLCVSYFVLWLLLLLYVFALHRIKTECRNGMELWINFFLRNHLYLFPVSSECQMPLNGMCFESISIYHRRPSNGKMIIEKYFFCLFVVVCMQLGFHLSVIRLHNNRGASYTNKCAIASISTVSSASTVHIYAWQIGATPKKNKILIGNAMNAYGSEEWMNKMCRDQSTKREYNAIEETHTRCNQHKRFVKCYRTLRLAQHTHTHTHPFSQSVSVQSLDSYFSMSFFADKWNCKIYTTAEAYICLK